MADPLSIIGVVGVAAQLIQITVSFGQDWKEAPSDAKAFKAELEALTVVLSELDGNILQNREVHDAFNSSSGARSSLLSKLGREAEDTRNLLSTCKEELDAQLQDLRRRIQGSKIGWERLKGAFAAKRTREAVENLHRQCRTLNSMVELDVLSLSSSIQNQVVQERILQKERHNSNVTMAWAIKDGVDGLSVQQRAASALADKKRRSALLQKLYVVPYEDRKDINPQRIEGTCGWFTEHSSFQSWATGESSTGLLWVTADAGCGKSVLTRHLIDDVLPMTESRVTCYFFFKDDFADQRSMSAALCCILRQIFVQQPSLLTEKLLDRFEEDGEALLSSFRGLWDILTSISKDPDTADIMCIIDALDECYESDLSQLAKALQDLYMRHDTDSRFAVKFLLTSRPYSRIQRLFQVLENRCPTIHLNGEDGDQVDKISVEIDLVVRNRVKEIGEMLSLDIDEEAVLLDELTCIPNRTYLWVYLALNSIMEVVDVTEEGLRESLSKIPKTVEAAYEKILCKSRDVEKAKKLLHIVVAAKRPLSLAEMALALSIREGHKSYPDVKVEPEKRFRRTVRELCGLFVTVSDSKIYLLHQTAREFLVCTEFCESIQTPTAELQWKHSLLQIDSHRILAEVCVRVIGLVSPEDVVVSRYQPEEEWASQFAENHVFLEYAARHWASHLRRAKMEHDAAILPMLCSICNPNSNDGKAWLRLYWSPFQYRQDTALSVAAYFGLAEVLRAYLRVPASHDVNHRSRLDGRTALFWAAQRGHESAVQVLLENGVNVDAKDILGQTALYYAAAHWHVGVLRQLLGSGADASSSEPLTIAAKEGDEGVVRLLLDHGCPVDGRNWDGTTALMEAAINDHCSIVELLLEKGADVHVQDSLGRTALWLALADKSQGAVKLLLDAGSEAKHRDVYGREPSWYDSIAVAATRSGGQAAVTLQRRYVRKSAAIPGYADTTL